MSKRDPRQEQALLQVALCGLDIRGLELHHTPSGNTYIAHGVTIRESDLVPCITYSRLGEDAGIMWSRPVPEFFFDARWKWSPFDETKLNNLREKAMILIWGSWEQVTP